MKIDTVVERVQPVAARIQENVYVKSITGGFLAALPALMFGAVCSMLIGFPVDAWKDWLAGNALGAALQFGSDATFGLLGLYAVIGIGYTLGRELKQDALATTIVSVVGFLLVMPFSTTVTSGETTIPVTGVIPTQWLGGQGIFAAIIVSLVATRLYALVVSRGWKIKMPASVPPNVSRPFEAIVPAAIVGTLFLAVHSLFAATSYGHLSQFIFSIIGSPLAHVSNSFGAWFVIVLLAQLCWVFGIHNGAVWYVVLPLMIGPATENQVAGAAGDTLPYTITLTVVFAIVQWVGGGGSLLGLSTNMILFAKSDRYKTLGRLAFPPSVFNITEPMMFGFPVVYNPLMAIPFVLVPLIQLTLGYVLISLGVIGVPWVNLPFSVMTMPFVPGGFLLGAGVGFGLFLIGCFVLSVVCYYPFFRIADKREQQIEQETAAAQAAAEVTSAAEVDSTRRLAPETATA
ncbi:PTS sugar transporter subunit IIC [Cellulomonas soli]|uniref:Permease IIC component n=1 Tax=Cellulomonas soli TaxID=931535 RepID=A0A512PD53_9CELL|nr:PTS transporter subunit EIIC [Cellulomonas soli]NYI60228.1 PTS system cellobiose-specific IIC component [Cellulomonas soli]GEP69118.1 permease IIC component [Cellulomonas soli]